jgi:hypothetical protein
MSNETLSTQDASKEGLARALALLESCSTEHGFFASTARVDNYNRIWARDGCVMGLAALLTDRMDLHQACRRTLCTLARHQGPHGEIPSNVDPRTGRVSYGGTAGRLDGNLWFVICSSEYGQRTGDHAILRELIEPLGRLRFLLGAWEYNNRGLLYVPLTGDWADEYLQTGYVLYDQLLYFAAQRALIDIETMMGMTIDQDARDRTRRLRNLIQANYWFGNDEVNLEDVYHEVLYAKARGASSRCANTYWAPFFSPGGYGYRFDTLANSLASLLGVADEHQAKSVDRHIAESVVQKEVMLLPAFHPVITSIDDDWNDLQMTFSYQFKNEPNEYHNGGLWPLVTGFYAASLARRGRKILAKHYTEGIHRANARAMEGEPWAFPEYLHGVQHKPGGTPRLGWSAAAAILAEAYLAGARLLAFEGESHAASGFDKN